MDTPATTKTVTREGVSLDFLPSSAYVEGLWLCRAENQELQEANRIRTISRHNLGRGIMAEGVTGDPLVQNCFGRRALDGALQDALMQVVAALEAVGVLPARADRDHPLPVPRPGRRRNPALDGIGKPHRAESSPQVVIVNRPSQVELMAQSSEVVAAAMSCGRRPEDGPCRLPSFPR